jgi:hypothetical protein
MHQHGQKKAERIDQDVPLASVYLLPDIVAAGSPFSVAFTLWLSMMAAEGAPSRPALRRACWRNSVSAVCHTPAFDQERK